MDNDSLTVAASAPVLLKLARSLAQVVVLVGATIFGFSMLLVAGLLAGVASALFFIGWRMAWSALVGG